MRTELAARLARYSALAYRAPVAVRDALPEAQVVFLERDDSQAYVIECEAMTAVAFRGTQVFTGFSPADVVSNLWIARASWHRGRVHAGYREALLDLVPALERALAQVRRPLYFTGHSMGGALATLASTLPLAPEATYSFGAPRAGDAAFARGLARVYRIVHGDDLASRFPLPLRFRHGGEAWHLTRDGRLERGLPLLWPLRIPLTMAALTRGVVDHRIEVYARKLAALAEDVSAEATVLA